MTRHSTHRRSSHRERRADSIPRRGRRGRRFVQRKPRRRWFTYFLLICMLCLTASVIGRIVRQLTMTYRDAQMQAEYYGRLHVERLADLAEEQRTDPFLSRKLCDEAIDFGTIAGVDVGAAAALREQLPTSGVLPQETRVQVLTTRWSPTDVQIDVDVTRADGRFAEGLSRIDFELQTGDQRLSRLQVTPAWLAAPDQSIAVVLDCSNSMKGASLASATQAASQFIRQIADPARVQLWAFSDSAASITPWTSDEELLVAAMQQLEAHGGTALYDAVLQAGESLSQRPEPRHLVLLTDGEDSAKAIPFADVIAACQQRNVQVHVIGLATSAAFDQQLQQLASETHGSFHRVSEVQLLTEEFAAVSRSLSKAVYRLIVLKPFPNAEPLSIQVGGLPPVLVTLPPDGSLAAVSQKITADGR